MSLTDDGSTEPPPDSTELGIRLGVGRVTLDYPRVPGKPARPAWTGGPAPGAAARRRLRARVQPGAETRSKRADGRPSPEHMDARLAARVPRAVRINAPQTAPWAAQTSALRARECNTGTCDPTMGREGRVGRACGLSHPPPRGRPRAGCSVRLRVGTHVVSLKFKFLQVLLPSVCHLPTWKVCPTSVACTPISFQKLPAHTPSPPAVAPPLIRNPRKR